MIDCFPSARNGIEDLADSTEGKGRCPLADRQRGVWGGLAWLGCGREGSRDLVGRLGDDRNRRFCV